MAIESPWITEDEAIAYLRMTGKTPQKVLRRWCKQKKIEYGKRGDQYVFKREWLDAFLMLNGSAGARREAQRQLSKDV